MADRQGYRRVRRFTFGRREVEREVEDELAFHLEQSCRELAATGLDPQAAREEALRRFGDLERYRATTCEIDRRRRRLERGGEIMIDLIGDLRFALRSFRKSPGFVAGVVLTLALGIGGTTAIFSVVYAVLLKPLPFPAPDRLVQLWEKNPERGWTFADAAPANFLDWRQRAKSFTDVTACGSFGNPISLAGDGDPESLTSWAIYPNFFSVLGVPPLYGRGFTEDEAWQGKVESVVVSYGLFRRRFGGDPGLVGRTVELNGRARTVVGVMPPGFSFPQEGIDLWYPFDWEPANRDQVWFRRAHFVRTFARLAPGVSLAAARGELEGIAAQLETEYPETNQQMGAGASPLHESVVRESRPALLLLAGAVGLVLLVACANVAGLQLARGAVRRRELGMRAALGASGGRLARQLVTESLALALFGGAAGLALASWAGRGLVALVPGGLPRGGEIGLDGTVLAFAFAATLAAGLLFGLAPAIGAVWRSRAADLGGGRSGTTNPDQQRARRLLVVAEVALALVLVTGAGLLLKSLHRLSEVDPGFDPQGGVAVQVSLPGARYGEPAQARDFFDQLRERARALPGVRAAALTDHLALSGSSWTSDFAIAGRGREDYGVGVHHRTVGPEYFRTLGVPLVGGRTFTSEDRPDAPRVVLVNDALARRYFPAGDAVGSRLCFDRYPDDNSVWRTIVGVVGDEKIDDLASPARPEIFESTTQDDQYSLYLVLRAAGDPLALVPSVRAAVHDLDPKLPLDSVTTLDDVVAKATARQRFLTLLLGLFAAVALTLAVVGVYGVIAYGVAVRRREIGIRMALGARLGRVLGGVLGEGLLLGAAGLLLGLAGALAATRLLSGMLFEVSTTDAGTFTAVAVVVAAVAAAASYLPARRAAAVDPAVTLRSEE
jgi:putative ABC transport system permease protein